MEKKKIRWEWTNNKGDKFNGDYEGEIQNNKPHGWASGRIIMGRTQWRESGRMTNSMAR